MEDTNYTEIFDVIIEIGKKNTLKKDYLIDDPEYFISLKNFLDDEYNTDNSAFINEINNGFKLLKEKLQQAILTVNNINPLSINTEDEESEDIDDLTDKLRVLNDAVFLGLAITELQTAFPFLNELKTELDKIIDDDIFNLQSYRLIPLNNQRKYISQGILEENLFLYPWLNEWTEYEPDAFFDIVNIFLNQFDIKKSEISEDLKPLFLEISNNKELFAILQKEALQIHKTQKELKESPVFFSLELARMIKNIMQEKEHRKYPVGVWNFTGTALFLMKDRNKILENFFLAVLCGPYLELDERAQKLNNFFKYINKNSIKSKNKLINKFIDSFHSFLETKNPDIEYKLATEAMKIWINKMAKVKPEQVLSVEDNKITFLEGLENTFFAMAEQTMAIPIITPTNFKEIIADIIPEQIKQIIDEVFNNMFCFKFALAAADDETKNITEIKFYNKDIASPETYIPLKSEFNYKIIEDKIFFNGQINGQITDDFSDTKINTPHFLFYYKEFNIFVIPENQAFEFPYWCCEISVPDKHILIDKTNKIEIDQLISPIILCFNK